MGFDSGAGVGACAKPDVINGKTMARSDNSARAQWTTDGVAEREGMVFSRAINLFKMTLRAWLYAVPSRISDQSSRCSVCICIGLFFSLMGSNIFYTARVSMLQSTARGRGRPLLHVPATRN